MKMNPRTIGRLRQSFIRLFSWQALWVLFLVSLPISVHGADVTLAWDANTEPDLEGYIIYIGTSSGSYPDSMDVGNDTQATVTGLDEQLTYYFAATAYDTFGNESDFSEEISYNPSTGSWSLTSGDSSSSGGSAGCFIAITSKKSLLQSQAGATSERGRTGLWFPSLILSLIGVGTRALFKQAKL